jgi:chromosomal replication initiator protein
MAEQLSSSAPLNQNDTPEESRLLTGPRYIFDNFIVGPSNEFAHAACLAVASQPGKIYNPLFIFGGVGLGKTHLLKAIGNKILQDRPQMRICYTSSEKFMNELVLSVRNGTIQAFQDTYRYGTDVLLMDDIQFIAGKDSTQNEFFHTFNALHEVGKQIVVTSDKFPKDIPGLEERLRTRFEWGLIADIQPPDVETRMAILRDKAERDGFTLPHDVAFFLADSIKTNIRELEGSLVRVLAYAKLTNQPMSVDLAKVVLKNVISAAAQTVMNTDTIIRLVARHFNLKPQELKSIKRTKQLAIPRQIAMYLARKYTTQSFPEIGQAFGGKDHTTIMHGVKKIADLHTSDEELASQIDSIESMLKRQ